MRRFSGPGPVDDREAARYHERFVSEKAEDRDFDNKAYQQGTSEYLGKLPDAEFQNAARKAVSQVPEPERAGFIGDILGRLGGNAGAVGELARMLGLGSSDPAKMSEDDASRVLNYARKQQPEVLQKTVEEKPWFVKAMGNPVVLGALAVAAAKLLKNQSERK